MGTNGQMSLHTGNMPSCHGSLDGMQQGNTDNSVLPRLAELDKTFVRWTHYGLVKMCLCHIRKTRSVIVPWTHIQPCLGHIYSRVLDTYTIVPWTRSISVSLTHLNMCLYPIYIWKKDKKY